MQFDQCPYKKRELFIRRRHGGECHVKTEGENVIINLQEMPQEWPVRTRSLERGSLEPPVGTPRPTSWFWTSPQNCQRGNSYCFKLLSLWCYKTKTMDVSPICMDIYFIYHVSRMENWGILKKKKKTHTHTHPLYYHPDPYEIGQNSDSLEIFNYL